MPVSNFGFFCGQAYSWGHTVLEAHFYFENISALSFHDIIKPGKFS